MHCTFSTLTYCNFYVRGIIMGFLYLNILRAVERNCVLLDLKLFFNPPYQCAFLTGLTFEVELNPHHVIILSNQVPDNIINAGHVGLLKKKGKLVNKISHGKEEKKGLTS